MTGKKLVVGVSSLGVCVVIISPNLRLLSQLVKIKRKGSSEAALMIYIPIVKFL